MFVQHLKRAAKFYVPAAKGDYRNLTASSGAHDREPAWSARRSADSVASDAGGEYKLMLGEPSGLAAPRIIPLPSTAFFSNLDWSPNGERILIETTLKSLDD